MTRCRQTSSAMAPRPAAYASVSTAGPCPFLSVGATWSSLLHLDDDLLRQADVLAEGIVVRIQQRRFLFERLEKRTPGNLGLAGHLAVLARQRRQHGPQPLALPFLGEVFPQQLLWRRVQAAVVTNLVHVDVSEQGTRLRRVLGFLQRIAPVLDLRIAREEKFLGAH